MISARPQTVRQLPDRQFVTGDVEPATAMMPDAPYAHALDALVIVCVDCIPVHRDRLLLSRRTRLPHADWWVNGGRMRKGELYQEAAARLMRQELGLALEPSRFRHLGYYSLIWDSRAQAPSANGCHTLSVVHTFTLDADELPALTLNDEYADSVWVEPAAVLSAPEGFHPALVQMIRDLVAAGMLDAIPPPG